MSFSARPIPFPYQLLLLFLILAMIPYSHAVVHASYAYCEEQLGQYVRIHILPSNHHCHLLVNGCWDCNVSISDPTRLPDGSDDWMCAFPRSGRVPGFMLEYSSSSSSLLSGYDFGHSDRSIGDERLLLLLIQHRHGAVNRTVDSINFASSEEANRCGREAITWCEYLGGKIQIALLRNDTDPPWVSIQETIPVCRLSMSNTYPLDIEVLTLYFGIDHWTNEDLKRALHMDEPWWEAAIAASSDKIRAPIAVMDKEATGWGE